MPDAKGANVDGCRCCGMGVARYHRRLVQSISGRRRHQPEAAQAAQLENVNYQHADFSPSAVPEELFNPNPNNGGDAVSAEVHNTYLGVKVGRNDPCPCGSGKKFKQCHVKLA
jgi:preprotein translocase subunit SecA